ncbi:hypothetical protein NQZ79_g8681 [Umbelopsis isabellina]|nr:hypothetical protein NQZ79_g8681 [Umbelopsis isabellina]
MEVLGLGSGRHKTWYSGCLSALARANSLAHTRLIGLGLIAAYLPSVSAASITQAADYIQGQIGANAVVLAFGALAGSGQAVMLEQALGAGPLSGVNKAIALITGKTAFSAFDERSGFNLRDKGKVHIPTLMRSVFLPQLSAWGIQTAAWAWCLVRSASPSTTAGHGLAVATYYLFLPYCTLWLYRFWKKGDPKVIVVSHHYEDPDSLTVEGHEQDSSKLLAQMRDRRDRPIVVHETHVLVRPSGDALQTGLNLWRCTTGTNVQFERKKNYGMRAVYFMLESIGMLWWVYTMALPGLDGGAWWPVVVMFIAAVVLNSQGEFYGPHIQWLSGDEYSRLERYLQQVAVWRYLPSAYVSDLRMEVTAQSVLATALLSGTLEDGWSSGPKVQLAEHLADDIYEVWWLGVEIDHTKLAHTGLTRRDKSKAISCSADMVEVARRLLNLSGHAATCNNGEKYIKRPDVGRLSTRAWLAWAGTHHKKCGAAVEDANWLADWVERNFWFLACHPGVQILPSPQSEQGKRITAAPTWRECARRALCSIYYPDDTEDMLHLAPLFIMGLLDENCIGIFEPAACVWAAWCDGLNVQVSGAYGCVTLRVGDMECTARAGSPIAEYTLELAKLGEASRQWHTALERLKLRVGDSTALVPYSGLLNFAWAGNTADDVVWDDAKGLTIRKTPKWSDLSLTGPLW